jgi:hypothetical protein
VKVQPAHFHRPAYTGAGLAYPPFVGQRGPCSGCGQPPGKCCCGWRECRKEAKELLVEASAKGREQITPAGQQPSLMASLGPQLSVSDAALAAAAARGPATTGTAFIGGGCCVHLSIEYAAQTPTQACIVLVGVKDADGTTLIWAKTEQPGAGYRIKENIITTKPGATVTVDVVNATARVRWCEVFSC